MDQVRSNIPWLVSLYDKRNGHFETETQTHREARLPCKDRGRKWSDVAINQGMLGLWAATRNEEGAKNSSLGSLKKSWLLFTPWFWSSKSPKIRENKFIFFNTPGLWQYVIVALKNNTVLSLLWWCFLFNYMFTNIRNCIVHPSSFFPLLLFSYHTSHLPSSLLVFDFRNMWNLNMHVIYLLTPFLNFQMTPWDKWLKGYFRGT